MIVRVQKMNEHTHEFVYYGYDTMKGQTKKCKFCPKMIFEGDRWQQ